MDCSDDTSATDHEEMLNSLILAITESGSTIVYYQISNGLVTPSDPPKEDEDDETSKRQAKRPKKHHKKGGPSSRVQETVAEYVNEEGDDFRDEFMEEEL